MSLELERLSQEINLLTTELKHLPPGKLIITKYQSRFKWYINNGAGLTYLPKAQKALAESLAKRKYLSLRLQELIHEKNAISLYLRHHSNDPNPSDELLNNIPYHNLLSPYFEAFPETLKDWSTQPYQHNPAYPEQLIHISSSGNIVRSKSEAFIDNALYRSKIPFRYECALELNDITLYPDFTILHPETKKIIYWEHFGLMDNPSYFKNVFSKLQLYSSNNIIPTIDLITTYETKSHPLSMELVDRIINHYFLI